MSATASGSSSHIFHSFMSNDLQVFKDSREKYIALEAARSVVRSLADEENIPNNAMQSTYSSDNAKFKIATDNLINEVYELQSEMSKKEFLDEKIQLMNVEKLRKTSVVPTNTILELEAEIEQAKIQLHNFESKNNKIDILMAQSQSMKEVAESELNIVKKEVVPIVQEATGTTSMIMLPSSEKECDTQSPDICIEDEKLNLQKQVNNVQALLKGLESLLRLKLVEIETTHGNGVHMKISINETHVFDFELDENKKLIDIQLDRNSVLDVSVLDPMRLLCDCASLPPPLDLRHALLATSAAINREQALQQHLTGSGNRKHTLPIYKLCLLHRDENDSCKVRATFRNGISATLKIHDCYPNVPNGVHIEELMSAVGGWSDEELNTMKSTLNNLCCQTIPDMVLKLLAFTNND